MPTLPRLVAKWPVFFAFLATFGLYFCSYALRKPFNTGTYQGYRLWGLELKNVLLLAQVGGYLLSKFMGIQVIGGLRKHQRPRLIVGLMGMALAGLLLFGLLPYQWGWVGLLLNGLPLGMMWGVIFSYVEGRRFTEVMAIGLSANLIVTSGVLKTFYFWIQTLWPVSEFWMPALIGLTSVPLALLCGWILELLPPPSIADNLSRGKRTPMRSREKWLAFRKYGPGLVAVIVLYAILTSLRDYRDNFYVEILHELTARPNPAHYAQIELLVAGVVLLCIAGLSAIKRHLWAFSWISVVCVGCLALLGGITASMRLGGLPAFTWLLSIGIAIFLPYLLIQTAYFERLLALLKMRGNVGYFVYLCDSFGYLGSISILLLKTYVYAHISHTQVLLIAIQWASGVGILLAIGQLVFFLWRYLRSRLHEYAIKLAAE